MYRGTRVIILAACFLAFAASVQAQYGYGYGQYSTGGGPSIIIDKAVAMPTSTKGADSHFVDNLSPSDPRFAPASKVFFRLRVKNTSDVKLTNVIVKDEFPQYVTPDATAGAFDEASRTLTLNAGDFAPQEEKEYFISATIASTSKLPQDKNLICLINKARVNTHELVDEDTSQFCVEQHFVQGVSEIPATGPHDAIPLLTLFSLVAALGIYIRKQA